MTAPLLEIRQISKSYGPAKIFSDISLRIRRNEVVGLAGENGAGKSTILKAIAGVIAPTAGTMLLHGKPYAPKDYSGAVTSGVSMVFQEQALLPNLQVYENIFFTYENLFRGGLGLDRKAMANVAEKKLQDLGLEHINVRAVTTTLPFHQRQMVEIAKAFILADFFKVDHPVILLDEPTAAIGEAEVRLLFECIARLRDRASFVIVTHKLSEYRELCDRLYVLKDGSLAGELARDQLVEDEIHRLMVGRERNEEFYQEHRQRATFGENRLSVQGLNGGGLKEISFDMAQGEIVGLGGLVGCGKEEVVRAIVGHYPYTTTGNVLKDGKQLPQKHRGPAAKMAGIGYVPKERKSEGIVPMMSVAENISLASLDLVSRVPKVISTRMERLLAEKYIKALRIRTTGPEQEISLLSGGNQQKAVLARWLARDVDILVLESPTRGVDVGAKEEIFAIIRDLADRGVSLLLVTDDLLELIGLSNRIIVMREGSISAELSAPVGNKPSETDIVQHMV